MPETMTRAELFGTQTKTAAELFGPDTIDPNKISEDIPNGDVKLDKKPSYRSVYEDILAGRQDWDSFIPAEKRAVLRQTSLDYEGEGKRLINSAYLSDLLGTDLESTYVTHDQLVNELLNSRTPTDAFERIKNRFNNGKLQVQTMDIGYNLLTGKITDQEAALKTIKNLQSQMTADAREDSRGFWEKLVGASAEQLPNMWEAIKAAPVGAGAGAVAGALIAAVAGQSGPQVAIPEETVTIPAGASFGIKFGGGLAAANRIRQLEAGSMYLELLDLKDDNGNRIDPNIAKITSHAVGVINGGLELAEWAVILETFGIGTKAFETAASKVTSRLAAEGTLRRLALKYSAKYGMALGAEVGQELAQESTNIVFGELAKELNNELKGTDIKHVTKEELLSRYYEIASESLKGFALLVAPGTIFSAAKEFVSRETAQPSVSELTQPPVSPEMADVTAPGVTEATAAKVAPVETQAAVAAVYEAPETETVTAPAEEVELTKQETADLAQLEAVAEQEDLYELKRVPKELRRKGVGFVVIEKETGKEAARFADRTEAKAKVAELNKAGKPVTSRRPPRGLLTSKSTVEKIVTEYTALKAAMKKAAGAARNAFVVGKREGILKAKEHYADLKAREKARKDLRTRVTNAVKKIKKAPPKNIDYFYRRAIEEIQNRIDPSYRTQKTRQKRQRMRDFLAQATPDQKAAFPQKLATLLDKKTLNELTVEDLEDIVTTIEQLKHLGKTKLKARKAIEKARYEKTVARLTEQAGSLPKVPVSPKGIDFSRRGLSDAIKNGYVWTLRIPRLMDWLDGHKGTFKGFWHQTFYDSVNRQTNAELQMADTRHRAGTSKMEELGITMNDLAEVTDFSTLQNGLALSTEQQMGIYAALKNPLATDAMVNGNEITLKAARAIVGNLDKKYRALADFIIDEYDEHYNRIRDVYVEQTNEDLGKETFYTPIVRLEQNEHVAQKEVIDQLLERHNLKKGYVQKKFTIDRKNIAPEHQKPMDLRLISVWQSQVQKQEHFIHFTKLVTDLRKLLASSKVRSVIDSVLGEQGVRVVDNYISRVANPTVYKAYDGLAGVSRILRRNVAMSYLSFNLMTIAKQAPSAVLYMKDAGPSAMLSSIWDFARSPREIWNFVRDRDPQIKHAFIEREIEELRRELPYIKDKDRLGKINKMIATVGDKGMIGIRYMDGIARTIGWYAVYQKNIQLGLSEAEASMEAQNATLRTQPAASPKDLAQLYATNEYLNWFTMFTNQLNNIWNITTYDTFAYWGNKRYQDSAMTLFSVGTNALILWMLVNKKLPEDEEDLVDAALDQSLNMIPLFNSGAMVGKRGWGSLTPPPLQAVTDVAKIYSAKDKEKQALNALRSTLVLTGIPVSAIRRAYRFAETGEPMELLGGQQKKKGIKL